MGIMTTSRIKSRPSSKGKMERVQGESKLKSRKLKAPSINPRSKTAKNKSSSSKVEHSSGKVKPAAGPKPEPEPEPEPEPVGEDDLAFFDNEENEAYANFILSLDESKLTTSTKRVKDNAASRPSKNKPTVTRQQEQEPPLAPPADRTETSASQEDSNVVGVREAKSLSSRRAKSAVDAKRRKPSTSGWVEEDTGPQRLPIKTPEGILKPNERMRSTPAGDSTKTPKPEAGPDSIEALGDDSVEISTAASDGAPSEASEDRVEDLDISDDEGSQDILASVGDSSEANLEEAFPPTTSIIQNGKDLAGASKTGGADLAKLKERRFLQKKSDMAELCETILGAPEESLSRPKNVPEGEEERSRIEQLLAMIDDDDHRVRHLAVLSQYAIFKDIIPSYRIRLPTAAELATTKVSKEVKRVRSQEAALLKAYQQYLKSLEAAIQDAGSSSGGVPAPGARSIAAAAIRCMCGLLSAHPHFNFRSNLVRTVVAGTNHKLSDIREACCKCLGDVFEADIQGEVTLEVTKAVAKFVKERKFHVSAGTIRCLSEIPLRAREDDRARAKARLKSKNRKRKREGSIEAGMMEADARVDEDLREKAQADALHEVMLTYFRVLKRRPPPPALFPAVMEGLAKFVHLVNLDTVQDLLDLLRDLLRQEDPQQNLPLRAALHCILASFRALEGPGRELQIDDAAFVSALYRRLPEILLPGTGGGVSEGETVPYVNLVYDCLEATMGKRRELSTARVVAMVKRLLSVALQLPQSANPAWGAGSCGLVRGAQRLLLRYPAAQQLLENEQDRPGAGPFRPDLEDPEHANALSSAAWELSALRHSAEPTLAAVVRDIVASGSQDAAAALATMHERGREAREAGTGEGNLAAAFAGVPPPEGRAIALGKMAVSDGLKTGSSKSKGQQGKKLVPKDGVNLKSAFLVRLARAGEVERKGEGVSGEDAQIGASEMYMEILKNREAVRSAKRDAPKCRG